MRRDELFPDHRPTGRAYDPDLRPAILGGDGDENRRPPDDAWPGDWGADLSGTPPDLPPEGAIRRALGVPADPRLKWPGSGSRWGVPLAAAAAVAVVALFVVGVVVVPSLRGSSGDTVAPGPASGVAQPVATSVSTGPASAVPGAVPVAAAGPTASAEGFRVYVVGQVRHPGVVSLPAGSRVEDALDAAGGATARADLTVINLARKVVDGEQITVVKPGQKPPLSQSDPGADGAAAGGADGAAGSGTGSGVASADDPVDLNTATAAQFDTLPGIGPVMAARIVAWRQQNGEFKTVDDLNQVSGIGDATMARLRPLVRV